MQFFSLGLNEESAMNHYAILFESRIIYND